MVKSSQYPLCESFVDRLIHKFNNNGWVTLCDERIFSCLANDSVVDKSMLCDTWDINHSQVGPLINEDLDGSFISYSRYENKEVEPIAMYLGSEGRWDEEVFLAEEFVMYFKLRKETKGKNEYVYYQIDECGDDVEIAKVSGIRLDVKLKYVKEYLAVKKLNLLVFTEELISSNKSIAELGCSPVHMETKEADYIFSYTLNEDSSSSLGYRSFAMLRGKCVYKHNENDIQHLWKLRDSIYEEFIVGSDENGNEILMSCEEGRMPNLFNRQGDEPYSLSPIFFKREVLSKYFQEVEKYSVQDGYISSGASWGLRIDNDRSDDYVVVALIDLGRIPHKEQIHWKNFNVLPPGDGFYSMTSFSRWFGAIPTDCSIAPDLVFKRLYVQVNNTWEKKYGWPLFKELAADDQYHFEALHLMGATDDQKEFDGLIQSITKLLIDSLNEKQLVNAIDSTNSDVKNFLKEKEVKEHSPSNIRGGITKFECFLVSEQAQNKDFVELLRKVQDLRSSTVAHRKSTKLDAKSKELFDFFGILQNSDKVVLFNLLVRLNEMLEWLILIVEQHIPFDKKE